MLLQPVQRDLHIWGRGYQHVRWHSHGLRAMHAQVQQGGDTCSRLHHMGVRDSKAPKADGQTDLLPGVLRDPLSDEVLHGFLQSCPEDCWAGTCFLILRGAEEVHHPAGVKAIPQKGMSYLTFRVCTETL